jgi:hypothetical protein
VQAERIARATTDDAAKEMLTRIAIEEEVAPDHVSIRTEGIRGILVGVSFEVRYRVRAPHSTVVRLRTTNGRVAVKAFSGRVFATSTNGGIIGEALGGSVEARTTNGNARIAMSGIGSEGVKVRTTNGRVDLTVPDSIKADLSASCRNGAIEISDVTFKPEGEQTRRQVRGTLNGGGPPIELSTVNGGIRIRAGGTSGASEL